MRQRRLFPLLFFSVSAVAPIAIAQAPAIKAPEPSKEIILKICTTTFYGQNLRCHTTQFLEERDGDLVYLIQQDGGQERGELVLTKHLATKVRPYPPATYVPHSYYLQFPLATGKSWRGTYDQTSGGQTKNRTRSAEVTAYVDIELKAGSYKAFKINAYNQWSEATSPAIEEYYYCPKLSFICRYESQEFDMKFEVVEVRKASKRDQELLANRSSTVPANLSCTVPIGSFRGEFGGPGRRSRGETAEVTVKITGLAPPAAEIEIPSISNCPGYFKSIPASGGCEGNSMKLLIDRSSASKDECRAPVGLHLRVENGKLRGRFGGRAIKRGQDNLQF